MLKNPSNFLPNFISFQISCQMTKFPSGRKFPSKWKRCQAQQESRDKELMSLRKQLYDIQMENDDKTIIGKRVIIVI